MNFLLAFSFLITIFTYFGSCTKGQQYAATWTNDQHARQVVHHHGPNSNGWGQNYHQTQYAYYPQYSQHSQHTGHYDPSRSFRPVSGTQQWQGNGWASHNGYMPFREGNTYQQTHNTFATSNDASFRHRNSQFSFGRSYRLSDNGWELDMASRQVDHWPQYANRRNYRPNPNNEEWPLRYNPNTGKWEDPGHLAVQEIVGNYDTNQPQSHWYVPNNGASDVPLIDNSGHDQFKDILNQLSSTEEDGKLEPLQLSPQQKNAKKRTRSSKKPAKRQKVDGIQKLYPDQRLKNDEDLLKTVSDNHNTVPRKNSFRLQLNNVVMFPNQDSLESYLGRTHGITLTDEQDRKENRRILCRLISQIKGLDEELIVEKDLDLYLSRDYLTNDGLLKLIREFVRAKGSIARGKLMQPAVPWSTLKESLIVENWPLKHLANINHLRGKNLVDIARNLEQVKIKNKSA